MISRLDYCNSVLAGVPLATLAPHTTPHHYYNEYSTQQHVQFSSSLEITSLQVPCNFHWLPVRWRIEYKLCCTMLSVHTGTCPAYPKNTVQLAAARQSRSNLRSSSTSAYIYFRGSRPSSVNVRFHTLVRPRGTHCLPTSATFQTLTVSESF